MELFLYLVLSFWTVFGGIVLFTKYENGEFFSIPPDRLNLTLFVYGPIGWAALGKLKFDSWTTSRIEKKTLEERIRIKKHLNNKIIVDLNDYRRQFK